MVNLIVTGGESPSSCPPFEYSKVICADSGYDTARELGLMVDEVIGDFDSTQYKEVLLKEGLRPLSRDKDFSDTECALRLLGEEPYDLLGGGGGRCDHFLSIMSLWHSYKLPRFWFTKADLLLSVEKHIRLKLETGSDISVFCATGKECRVLSKGLKWPLDSLLLSSSFLSLSNRVSEEVVELECSEPVFVRLEPRYLPYLENVLE